MRKIILLSLALIFLVFAIIAIILPGLPATPFVASSSFFAMRSHKGLDAWIKSRPFYKETVGSFKENRSLTLKAKIRILLTAAFMLSFPFYFTNSTIFRIFIILLLIAKTIAFTFWIKTAES